MRDRAKLRADVNDRSKQKKGNKAEKAELWQISAGWAYHFIPLNFSFSSFNLKYFARVCITSWNVIFSLVKDAMSSSHLLCNSFALLNIFVISKSFPDSLHFFFTISMFMFILFIMISYKSK